MHNFSKELGYQGEFEKSMKDFLTDPEMSESTLILAEELLGSDQVVLGATSRGFSAKEHAFNPYDLDTHLDGIYAFGVYTQAGEEVPATMYSFNFIKGQSVNSLDIVQIQAVQSYPEGVPFRRWEPFGLYLIEMFAEWRRDIGVTMVRPIAENNWLNNFKTSPDHQIGRLRYDIGAKRTGYAYESSLKRFIKYLP